MSMFDLVCHDCLVIIRIDPTIVCHQPRLIAHVKVYFTSREKKIDFTEPWLLYEYKRLILATAGNNNRIGSRTVKLKECCQARNCSI